MKAHQPMFPKSIAAMGNLGVSATYDSAVHFPGEGVKVVPQLLGGVFLHYMAVFNLLNEVKCNQSAPQHVQSIDAGMVGWDKRATDRIMLLGRRP